MGEKRERTGVLSAPKPRKPRGQRYDWLLLLTLIAAALVAGMRSNHAMAHWGFVHADDLLASLQPARGRLPSESTMVRALRALDIDVLETHLTRYSETLDDVQIVENGEHDPPITSEQESPLEAQAIDGKTVRGASNHGEPVHLVSRIQHATGVTRNQVRVEQKRNERSAVPKLLAEQRLDGVILTLDALHTQRAQAQQIIDQGGHYLMVVKKNQRRLWEHIDMFFRLPAIPADEEQWDRVTTVGKGHGRLEVRTLECGSGMELDWPGAVQIIRRTTERTHAKTGKGTRAVMYGITSAPLDLATAADLERFWRGHWTIEHRKHYVRDVTFGEDAGQTHTGSAPQALAALRNTIIDLFRWRGWKNMADAIRWHDGSVDRALMLIGALPQRL